MSNLTFYTHTAPQCTVLDCQYRYQGLQTLLAFSGSISSVTNAPH